MKQLRLGILLQMIFATIGKREISPSQVHAVAKRIGKEMNCYISVTQGMIKDAEQYYDIEVKRGTENTIQSFSPGSTSQDFVEHPCWEEIIETEFSIISSPQRSLSEGEVERVQSIILGYFL